MPEFHQIKEKKDTQEMAIRQVLAWNRCKAFIEDGSGGVWLYRRVGVSTATAHITAAELNDLRARYTVRKEPHREPQNVE